MTCGDDGVGVDERAGAVEPAARGVEPGVDIGRDVEQQLADVRVLTGVRRTPDDGLGRHGRREQGSGTDGGRNRGAGPPLLHAILPTEWRI